jgi:hypothetical protein
MMVLSFFRRNDFEELSNFIVSIRSLGQISEIIVFWLTSIDCLLCMVLSLISLVLIDKFY